MALALEQKVNVLTISSGLSPNLVPTESRLGRWLLLFSGFSSHGLKRSSRFAPDRGDKTVGQAELRFRQPGVTAFFNHIADSGAHAFDIFCQVKRLGQKRIGRNRAVRFTQFLQRQGRRQGAGIPYFQTIGKKD